MVQFRIESEGDAWVRVRLRRHKVKQYKTRGKTRESIAK
jgi:hypothetical protein